MSETSFSVAGFTSAVEQSVSRVFMDFAQATSCNPEALFAFYEGCDNDYYYHRLQQHTNRQIENIKCGNKANVIRVYKMIAAKPEYKNYHKGYFVDKDFDLNDEAFLSDFYVTGSYSIENFYASDSCMELFLTQTYDFRRGDTQFQTLMSEFRQMRQRYLEAIVLFNTWYCAIKRKYGNSITGISLNPGFSDNYITWDFSSKDVRSIYTLQTIENTFAAFSSYPVTLDEMADAESYIRTDLLKNLRGKYCIGFIVRYINELQGYIKNTRAYSKHHRKLGISKDNVMSILTMYADTEPELIEYISRIAA